MTACRNSLFQYFPGHLEEQFGWCEEEKKKKEKRGPGFEELEF